MLRLRSASGAAPHLAVRLPQQHGRRPAVLCPHGPGGRLQDYGADQIRQLIVQGAERFEDCLECLACVSACPVASGDPRYLGPAVLAAADRAIEEPRSGDPARILALVNTEHGVWQCRSVWSCSAVCPAGVDPAARIMSLRRRVWRAARTERTGGSAT